MPKDEKNTSNPQTVFIKITNTISNCFVTLPIELIVNLPPIIKDFKTYEICTNETNSIDLTEINEFAVDVNFNVLFKYCPLMWDENIFVPLPSLDDWIVEIYKENEEEAKHIIDFHLVS